MDVRHAAAAGLDMHKMRITATVRSRSEGRSPHVETREFSALASGLALLVQWSLSLRVTGAVQSLILCVAEYHLDCRSIRYRATFWMRRRVNQDEERRVDWRRGVGESPTGRKANHQFHHEPCGRLREDAGEASAVARAAVYPQFLSRRSLW